MFANYRFAPISYVASCQGSNRYTSHRKVTSYTCSSTSSGMTDPNLDPRLRPGGSEGSRHDYGTYQRFNNALRLASTRTSDSLRDTPGPVVRTLLHTSRTNAVPRPFSGEEAINRLLRGPSFVSQHQNPNHSSRNENRPISSSGYASLSQPREPEQPGLLPQAKSEFAEKVGSSCCSSTESAALI